MPTPNFGLPLYTVDDTAELDVLLNGQSNAIDAALASNEFRTGGTDAARLALVAPRRKEGLEWYSTDTNREWFYDGANWVSAENGMYLVRPATATNGVVNSDGSVTATGGAGSLSLNGVFSSRFRRYRILFTFGTAAQAIFTVRMRNAGADDTTTSYGSQFNYANGGSVAAANNASAALWGNFGPGTGSTVFWGDIEITAPGLSGSGSNFTKLAHGTVGGIFNQQTIVFSSFMSGKEGSTFDGITFTSGSTFLASSSSFRVYGLV